MNYLQFNLWIYIFLAIFPGLVIVCCPMMILWCVKGCYSLAVFSRLIFRPPIIGLSVFLFPLGLITMVVYCVFVSHYTNFEDYTGKYTDTEALTTARIEGYRSGRLGFAFIFSDISDDNTSNYKMKLRDDIGTFSKKQQSIASFWVKRARRIVDLRRLVDGIISSQKEVECDECQTKTDNLSVTQIIPLESLISEFDKKVSMGIDGLDDLHPVIAWRKFFTRTQLFRTLCTNCLSQKHTTKFEKDKDLIISDDEGDEEREGGERDDNAIQFDGKSKNILSLWLKTARSQREVVRRSETETRISSISETETQTMVSSDTSSLSPTESGKE